MAFGLKEARETVTETAEKLKTVAADTRAAVMGAAILGAVALIVGVIALVFAVRSGKAVAA